MAGTADTYLKERAAWENKYDDIEVIFPNGIHPGARASREWPGRFNGVIDLVAEPLPPQQPGVGNFSVMMQEPPRHNPAGEERRRIYPPPPKQPPPRAVHQHSSHAVDRLASEQLPMMWNLPSVHRMYHYGPRQVWFSEEVPVPEHNRGVMVNAEFAMLPQYENAQVVYDDWAIRNQRWRHIGAMLPRESFADELASWRRHHKAEWDQAYDIKPNHMIPDYVEVHKRRERPLFEVLDENLEREILNENELRDFFSDPRAVRQETILY